MYFIKATGGNLGNPMSLPFDGCVTLPDELLSAYLDTKGFCTVTVDEDGMVTDVIVNQDVLNAYDEERSKNEIDTLREQRITDSKADLAAWLAENPLTWTDGKKYAVTSEKQAQLTSTLAVQQVAESAGVQRELRWNSTGNECTVWKYSDLCALSLAIAAYVEPRVSNQQAAEVDLRKAKTKEEVLAVAWNYA